MSLTDVALMTMVTWQARNAPNQAAYQGCYRIVTKDVGATIGVGVYGGQRLLHSFYAHTRYNDRALEITRDLIAEAVEFIQHSEGAEYVAASFPQVFRKVTEDAQHKPLDPKLLTSDLED